MRIINKAKNMSKKLSGDDKKIWNMITKTIKPINPLRAGQSSFPDDPKGYKGSFEQLIGVAPGIKNKASQKNLTQSLKPNKLSSSTSQEVDKRTLQKLKKGQIRIDYTLDLHGHNLSDARASLRSCITTLYAKGGRCLLLIHGRGSITGHAKIKKAFPDWLSDMGDIVLTHAPARTEHGGAGATYVLLRRKRV